MIPSLVVTEIRSATGRVYSTRRRTNLGDDEETQILRLLPIPSSCHVGRSVVRSRNRSAEKATRTRCGNIHEDLDDGVGSRSSSSSVPAKFCVGSRASGTPQSASSARTVRQAVWNDGRVRRCPLDARSEWRASSIQLPTEEMLWCNPALALRILRAFQAWGLGRPDLCMAHSSPTQRRLLHAVRKNCALAQYQFAFCSVSDSSSPVPDSASFMAGQRGFGERDLQLVLHGGGAPRCRARKRGSSSPGAQAPRTSSPPPSVPGCHRTCCEQSSDRFLVTVSIK